jgi:aminoglycoside 3-N-acetyltransferase
VSLTTRNDVVVALRQLGVTAGMHLFVHSSLSSIGEVDGGADAVVDGLLDAVGPEGTIMVPTFSFSGTHTFDVSSTPSKTGAITETLRHRQYAVRSWHPTHASCAIGPHAEWLMHDHLRGEPLGIDSPEDRIAKLGGYILLLGVGHTVNSTVHVGEAYVGAPARRTHINPLTPAQKRVITPQGDVIPVTATEMPGCSRGFGAIESPLRYHGVIADGRVGNADCQLMQSADVIAETVNMLRTEPYSLLCSVPNCGTCTNARLMLDARSVGGLQVLG